MQAGPAAAAATPQMPPVREEPPRSLAEILAAERVKGREEAKQEMMQLAAAWGLKLPSSDPTQAGGRRLSLASVRDSTAGTSRRPGYFCGQTTTAEHLLESAVVFLLDCFAGSPLEAAVLRKALEEMEPEMDADGLPDDAVDLIGGESQLPFPAVAAVSGLLQPLLAWGGKLHLLCQADHAGLAQSTA